MSRRAVPQQAEAVYDTNAVDDVAVVAATEKVVDVPIEGEGRMRITWTGDGAGTINLADLCLAAGV